MNTFLTFVFRDADGIGFTVPDIPGFTAHAETASIDEAVEVARKAFDQHIGAMAEAGLEVPAPRSLDDLRADPDLADDWAEAVATVFIPAMPIGGDIVRVNISLDRMTLDLIDRAAKARGTTRSGFLVDAARAVA